MNTCSHVWKDQRFIRQFVHNNPVSPFIDPSKPQDGVPRGDMQYGQTYECCNCHSIIRPIDSTTKERT